jgi:hypothetical protein
VDITQAHTEFSFTIFCGGANNFSFSSDNYQLVLHDSKLYFIIFSIDSFLKEKSWPMKYNAAAVCVSY